MIGEQPQYWIAGSQEMSAHSDQDTLIWMSWSLLLLFCWFSAYEHLYWVRPEVSLAPSPHARFRMGFRGSGRIGLIFYVNCFSYSWCCCCCTIHFPLNNSPDSCHHNNSWVFLRAWWYPPAGWSCGMPLDCSCHQHHWAWECDNWTPYSYDSSYSPTEWAPATCSWCWSDRQWYYFWWRVAAVIWWKLV